MNGAADYHPLVLGRFAPLNKRLQPTRSATGKPAAPRSADPQLRWADEMKEIDALTWYVFDALADDWESIVQIRPHVAEFHGHASDEQILEVLRKAHAEKLIRLMDEEGLESKSFPDDPSGYWFSMTESGRSLWDSEGAKYRDE